MEDFLALFRGGFFGGTWMCSVAGDEGEVGLWAPGAAPFGDAGLPPLAGSISKEVLVGVTCILGTLGS